jgi:hypothetical protein
MAFRDMASDYSAIENCKEQEDEEEPEEEEGQGAGGEDAEAQEEGEGLDEPKNPLKFDKDEEAYLSVKGVLTIERIKDIVGGIMGSCQKKMRYELCEAIVKGVVFEKRPLRQSFMQEVLRAADNAAYLTAFQAYINRNGLTIENFFDDTPGADATPTQHCKSTERVIEISEVDVNVTAANISGEENDDIDKDKNFLHRLFVLTNKGI